MTLSIFSLIYALIVIILFYGIRRSSRLYFLALASLGYIFLLDPEAGAAVMITFILTWLAGLFAGYLQKKNYEKRAIVVCVTSIIICVACLCFFKLYVFTGILIPLGFSYYIFQVISYFSDIVHGDIQPERNPVHLLIYLAWFPKFVSGPIERKKDFDKQLEAISSVRFRDPDRWVRSFHYFLTGLFYKLVIADRLGRSVDMIYDNMNSYAGAWLFIGMFMYTFQIYFDFAGYSYAAMGLSEAFGIRLTENFKMPYFAANISEFWRRWHISLSRWLKDYIYIPLGGNKKGLARKILNTMIVFSICGIWHGESLSFLVWGLLHGIYSAIDTLLVQKGYKRIRTGTIGRILTFIFVAIAWVFFRASDLSDAIDYFRNMFNLSNWFAGFDAQRELMGLWKLELTVLMLPLIAAFIVEAIAYRKDINVPDVIIKRPYYIRYIVTFIMLVVIMVFGIYGPGGNERMIYMQF